MNSQSELGQALAARLATVWQTAEKRLDAARPDLRDRAWRYFLVAGLVMTVGYFVLPGPDVQNVAYQIPEMLAVLAILAGVAIHRPADPSPWLTLAGGLTLTTLGDWTWVVLEALGQEPFPSIADLFYLGGVALIITALLFLVRGRVPGGDRSSLLDAVIVAAGVGMLSWVFLMHPIAAGPEQSFWEVAVALAYPVADLLLLAVLARLFLVPGKRVDAFYLLVGALVAQMASDSIFAFQAVQDTYQTGQLVDAGWLMSFAFWGTAALHPSMRQVARPIEHGEIGFSWWRLALLGGASLMAPAVLVIQWVSGADLNIPVIAAGCAVLYLLVIARLGGVVHDLRTTLGQRKVLEEALERRSLTDPLTGLANRVLFHERLDHALAQREQKAAVLFVDLDDFKTVNDAYGHEAGDMVLRAVADAIRRAVRPGDTAARLGGDEFAVLVEDGLDTYQVGALAERVLAAVGAPILIQTSAAEGRDYLIGASIGISQGTAGASDGQQMMREADIAMYVAKGQGKGRFCVFEPAIHAPVLRSLELRTDLEEAIRTRQFELHYQPILDLASGGLAGMEALVRWRHPTRGVLMPEDFIPLAEATGAIVPLGRWILDEACREAVTWSAITPTAAAALGVAPTSEEQSPPSVRAGSSVPPPSAYGRPAEQPAWAPSRRRPFMSVNLSAVQLTDESFAGAAAELLRSVGLSPRDLVLETTESTRLDQDAASVALRQIRTTGIRLAIDDFGTGYASLSQLRRIPFDIVKIDQTFVAALGPGSRAESLIAGIVDLARKLNILVIAEGIETAEQLARLRQMGCGLGQGYYFAEPMPAAELRALLGLPQPPRRRASGSRQPTFVTRPLPKAGT